VVGCSIAPAGAETVTKAKPSTVAPQPIRRAVNTPTPLSKELTPPLDKTLLEDAKTPEHKMLADKLAERDRIQQEIEALCEQLQTGEQIWIELRMLEVNLTEMRKLGLDFTRELKGYRSSRDDADLLGFLKSLEKEGLSRQLFSPCVTTASGQEASVFVGVQTPMPAAADSIQTVEYVEYGQRLNVLPVALGSNRVRIAINAGVSSGGERPETTEIGERRLPTIEETACSSTVEMSFGETVMLTGLASKVASEGNLFGLGRETNDVQLVVV
jgi:Flp pilus assembly secretin CpaC